MPWRRIIRYLSLRCSKRLPCPNGTMKRRLLRMHMNWCRNCMPFGIHWTRIRCWRLGMMRSRSGKRRWICLVMESWTWRPVRRSSVCIGRSLVRSIRLPVVWNMRLMNSGDCLSCWRINTSVTSHCSSHCRTLGRLTRYSRLCLYSGWMKSPNVRLLCRI